MTDTWGECNTFWVTSSYFPLMWSLWYFHNSSIRQLNWVGKRSYAINKSSWKPQIPWQKFLTISRLPVQNSLCFVDSSWSFFCWACLLCTTDSVLGLSKSSQVLNWLFLKNTLGSSSVVARSVDMHGSKNSQVLWSTWMFRTVQFVRSRDAYTTVCSWKAYNFRTSCFRLQ